MDGYILFIENLPLRCENLGVGERSMDVSLPICVTHPAVGLDKIIPQFWAVDTSLSGASITSPWFLHRHYGLQAKKKKTTDTIAPNPPELQFLYEKKIITDAVGSAEANFFEANFWLCSNIPEYAATPYLIATGIVATQVDRSRTLLSRDLLFEGSLRILISYPSPTQLDGIPTVSVWIPKLFLTSMQSPEDG